jgi:hypothetical protein
MQIFWGTSTQSMKYKQFPTPATIDYHDFSKEIEVTLTAFEESKKNNAISFGKK